MANGKAEDKSQRDRPVGKSQKDKFKRQQKKVYDPDPFIRVRGKATGIRYILLSEYKTERLTLKGRTR